MDRWLPILVERNAADLFLVAGFPPAIRIDGVVTPLSETPLDGDEIETAVLPLLPQHAVKAFHEHGSCDTSLRREGLGRFRVNLHRERGRAAATVRALPVKLPRLADLALPEQVARLSSLPHGLVLVG